MAYVITIRLIAIITDTAVIARVVHTVSILWTVTAKLRISTLVNICSAWIGRIIILLAQLAYYE